MILGVHYARHHCPSVFGKKFRFIIEYNSLRDAKLRLLCTIIGRGKFSLRFFRRILQITNNILEISYVTEFKLQMNKQEIIFLFLKLKYILLISLSYMFEILVQGFWIKNVIWKTDMLLHHFSLQNFADVKKKFF